MEKGLSHLDVIKLQSEYGLNLIEGTSQFSVVKTFLSQFTSVINGILLVAALFFFFTNDTLDAFFIAAIIILNALLGFFQEYKAEKSLEKLKAYTVPTVRVIRDGSEQQIESIHLVPGDIVILSEGDRIPADGLVYNTHTIEIDESILTGESLPLLKTNGQEIFLGTLVTKGKGHLKVTAIGKRTKFGRIAQSLSEIELEKTPLQKQLSQLGKYISFCAIGVSLFLIPIELLQGKDLIPIILVATSIGIAAIPEGLPAVITIALALGTNRMAKRNAIIRKMPAIETLGAVQYIITDKTGTLTQNQMKVKKFWTNTSPHALSELLKCCVLGNTASLIQKADGTFDTVGDKTDAALLMFAKHEYQDIDRLLSEGKKADEYVFDSTTKTISTIWEKDAKRFVYVRGAPEVILEKSTLGEKEKQETTVLFESYAKEGLRVIAFGYKEETHHGNLERNHFENGIEFLGFVGIYDPPRPQVKDAIKNAQNAGITVIMVTGDNELTALAIAKEIGIITDNQNVVTGEELKKISQEELSQLITKTAVFARTQPADKLRLVNTLRKRGFVVGVTGDGVNDALALKQADVGVSMGLTGTDVAKEASDIILADDNFETLVKAIEEGRTIYHNIVKSIIYLLSGNLLQLSLVFFAALFGLPTPFLPTQILWINLITDGLPALALASDVKDPTLLSKKPRNPKAGILTKNVIIVIMIIGFCMAISLFLTYSLLLQSFSETQSRTIVFNLLVAMRLLIAFIVRGNLIFQLNKTLIAIVGGTLFLQVATTFFPVFQQFLHVGW